MVRISLHKQNQGKYIDLWHIQCFGKDYENNSIDRESKFSFCFTKFCFQLRNFVWMVQQSRSVQAWFYTICIYLEYGRIPWTLSNDQLRHDGAEAVPSLEARLGHLPQQTSNILDTAVVGLGVRGGRGDGKTYTPLPLSKCII